MDWGASEEALKGWGVSTKPTQTSPSKRKVDGQNGTGEPHSGRGRTQVSSEAALPFSRTQGASVSLIPAGFLGWQVPVPRPIRHPDPFAWGS